MHQSVYMEILSNIHRVTVNEGSQQLSVFPLSEQLLQNFQIHKAVHIQPPVPETVHRRARRENSLMIKSELLNS